MDRNNLVKEMLEMAREQLETISETSKEEKMLLLREVNAQLAQLSRDSKSKKKKLRNGLPAPRELPPAFPKKGECKPQPEIEHEHCQKTQRKPRPDDCLFYPLPEEICARELMNKLRPQEGLYEPHLEKKECKPCAECKTEAETKEVEDKIREVYCSCACLLKLLDSFKEDGSIETDTVYDPESLCKFTANQSEVLRDILTESVPPYDQNYFDQAISSGVPPSETGDVEAHSKGDLD